MNHGSFRGNAQGVKIKFLAEIKATKANPKYTMVHYLNEFLVEHKDQVRGIVFCFRACSIVSCN